MIEKERYVDFIIQIFSYSQVARIRGLLYLEEFLEDFEPEYFRNGMEQIISGTDPAEVSLFCKEFISQAENPDEKLFREIAAEGLSRIQCGDQSAAVWMNLADKIGSDGQLMVKRRLFDFEQRKNMYFNSLTRIQIHSEILAAFNSIVFDEFIFMPGSLILFTDCFTLATALRCFSPVLQARVLQNLPMNEMTDVMDTYKSDEPSVESIENAIQEILENYA